MSETYYNSFQHWARETVDEFNAWHRDHPPFELEEFDGCTFGLDVCRHCCLIHDLRYWFRDGTKTAADAELWRCIAAIGDDEDWFKWVWKVIASVYWLAVTVGGQFYWGPLARRRRPG